MLDYGPRRFRDPEYGKRIAHLQDRISEHPERSLVVVIGSSRTAMGVRPDVLNDPTQPLLFNMSLVGSGPIMELLTVRRMLADGVTPDVVLLEYWPAFLREDGPYSEEGRFHTTRLYPMDQPMIRDYWHAPAATMLSMSHMRLSPWYSHRMPMMNQVMASWLPANQRTDSSFERIDPWGWLPGHKHSSPALIEAGHAASAGFYVPLFQNYQIGADADRAIYETVSVLRAAGVRVAFLYMPESARFQSFMTPAAVALAKQHLEKTRLRLDLPLMDCRGWVVDEQLPDGFHLTQPGAAEFTHKLVPAISDLFPDLSRAP
ncbi:MAG: hypothetical protein LC104_10800 [Bacteroidales bacterium]|nr:hypothetical protein [Bacteroidales bacterium]